MDYYSIQILYIYIYIMDVVDSATGIKEHEKCAIYICLLFCIKSSSLFCEEIKIKIRIKISKN